MGAFCLTYVSSCGSQRILIPESVARYKLTWPQPGSSLKVVHGGMALSLQGGQQQRIMDGSTTFMVGTEGGRVFKCYLELNEAAVKDFAKAAASGEKLELRNPIKEADYTPHGGSVFGLDCSPFQRDLFLTSGYDGSVHLYHSLKQQHLLEVVPTEKQLFAVQWSPTRPLVFATAAGPSEGCCVCVVRSPSPLLQATAACFCTTCCE